MPTRRRKPDPLLEPLAPQDLAVVTPRQRVAYGTGEADEADINAVVDEDIAAARAARPQPAPAPRPEFDVPNQDGVWGPSWEGIFNKPAQDRSPEEWNLIRGNPAASAEVAKRAAATGSRVGLGGSYGRDLGVEATPKSGAQVRRERGITDEQYRASLARSAGNVPRGTSSNGHGYDPLGSLGTPQERVDETRREAGLKPVHPRNPLDVPVATQVAPEDMLGDGLIAGAQSGGIIGDTAGNYYRYMADADTGLAHKLPIIKDPLSGKWEDRGDVLDRLRQHNPTVARQIESMNQAETAARSDDIDDSQQKQVFADIERQRNLLARRGIVTMPPKDENEPKPYKPYPIDEADPTWGKGMIDAKGGWHHIPHPKPDPNEWMRDQVANEQALLASTLKTNEQLLKSAITVHGKLVEGGFSQKQVDEAQAEVDRLVEKHQAILRSGAPGKATRQTEAAGAAQGAVPAAPQKSYASLSDAELAELGSQFIRENPQTTDHDKAKFAEWLKGKGYQ